LSALSKAGTCRRGDFQSVAEVSDAPAFKSGIRAFKLSSRFVVVSQYRGTYGSEGHDEFGRADLHDVMNLIPLAPGLSIDLFAQMN